MTIGKAFPPATCSSPRSTLCAWFAPLARERILPPTWISWVSSSSMFFALLSFMKTTGHVQTHACALCRRSCVEAFPMNCSILLADLEYRLTCTNCEPDLAEPSEVSAIPSSSGSPRFFSQYFPFVVYSENRGGCLCQGALGCRHLAVGSP